MFISESENVTEVTVEWVESELNILLFSQGPHTG